MRCQPVREMIIPHPHLYGSQSLPTAAPSPDGEGWGEVYPVRGNFHRNKNFEIPCPNIHETDKNSSGKAFFFSFSSFISPIKLIKIIYNYKILLTHSFKFVKMNLGMKLKN